MPQGQTQSWESQETCGGQTFLSRVSGHGVCHHRKAGLHYMSLVSLHVSGTHSVVPHGGGIESNQEQKTWPSVE